MEALPRRARRETSALLLAALLLVPVFLSGHIHVGPSPHPCSVCAVTHHAPIAGNAALPALRAQFACFVATPRPAPAYARIHQARRTGRAPPSSSFTVVA